MEAIEKDIEQFLAINNSSGSGYGNGDGSGSCYDYCSGYGYGNSSGAGNSFGAGDGSGFGSGSGSSAYYGFGSGDGYSDNIKEFGGRKIYYVDNVPTLIQAVRGDVARGAVLRGDMTLKDCWIARRGHFFAHGDTLREAVEAVEAKWLENRPLDKRIADFVVSHPELDKPYNDLFNWHHVLTGSCEFGRRQWCEEHGHKPTDSITVREFLTGTANDYGGEVIRTVAERYSLLNI